MVADIAGFNRRVFCDFAFHTEAPGLHTVRPEVGRDGGLILRAWIDDPWRQRSRQLGPDIGSGGLGRHWQSSSIGPREALEKHLRRRGGYIQIDVVERRVIQVTIAATDHRSTIAGEPAA